MRIIYCGYGRAALECLYQLILNFDVKTSDIMVFTHNSPENKDFIDHLKNNKFTVSFDNINSSNSKIKDFCPDYLLSVYYRFIVNHTILSMVDNKAMNLHPSLLPAYRGTKSSVWALLNNEKYTGGSFHYMDDNIDTGNIILQKKIIILDNDTAYSIYHKIVSLFVVNFQIAFNLMINGYEGKKQHGEYSYFPRELPFGGKLELDKISFEEASRFIKAMFFPPYKGAVFKISNGLEVEINSIPELLNYMDKK
jgi:methionyl-tRNA formyltransferase